MSLQEKQKFIAAKKEAENNQKAYNSLTKEEKKAYANMSPQQKQQLLEKKKQQIGISSKAGSMKANASLGDKQRKQEILKNLTPIQRDALRKMPPEKRKAALAKLFNKE